MSGASHHSAGGPHHSSSSPGGSGGAADDPLSFLVRATEAATGQSSPLGRPLATQEMGVPQSASGSPPPR